jgi:hypothetical protein
LLTLAKTATPGYNPSRILPSSWGGSSLRWGNPEGLRRVLPTTAKGMEQGGRVCTTVGYSAASAECSLKMLAFDVAHVLVAEPSYVIAALGNSVAGLRMVSGFGFRLEYLASTVGRKATQNPVESREPTGHFAVGALP